MTATCYLASKLPFHRNSACRWVINVAYTLIGDALRGWVKEKCDERNEAMAEKHDMNIEMDPEILAVVKKSTAVATQKGSGVFLLKPNSKRRRTKAEIEELKALEKAREEVEESHLQEIMSLRQELHDAKMQMQSHEESHHVVSQMVEAGILSKGKSGYQLVNQ